MKTLLICLLYLSACLAAAFTFPFPRPSLKPDNPFSFFGEELVLTCSLTGKNSSQAYIQEGNDNVTDDFLSRPDDHTLVYTVGNTSRFEGEVTNCNGISLSCWHPDWRLPGGQILHVDYKPAVRNADCVYYNAHDAKCSWDLLPDWGSASDFVCRDNYNVSAYIKRIGSDSTIDCPTLNLSSCTSEANSLETVDLVILVQNTKRPNTTFNFTTTFNLEKRVKHEPVTELTATTVNMQKVNLTWKHVKAPSNIRVRAKITPLNGTGFSHELNENATGSQWMIVEGLNPAVQYRARVDVLDKYSGGIWSDPQHTTFTMPPDAPDLGPPTTAGAYSQKDSCSSPGAQSRDVTVFWKELPEEHWNGALTAYVLQYSPRGQQAVGEVRVAADQTKAVLPGLDCSLPYTVHIFAVNTQESASFTVLELPPSDAVAPVSQLLVRLSSTVSAQWTSSQTPVHFTLFWCKKNQSTCFGIPGQCQCGGPVQWRTVPGDRREEVIQELNPNDSIHSTFRFGISTTVPLGSSRIVWEDCIYQAYATPTTPPQQVLVMNKTEAVEVTYIPDTCVTSANYAYVKAYRIRWCLASNFHGDSCSSGGDSMLVNATQGGRVRLTALQPWQVYMVQVEAQTLDNLFGPPSPPQPAMLLPPTGLQNGEIAGLVSGLLIFIIVAATVIFCVCRCRKMKTLEVNIPKQPTLHGTSNPALSDDDEFPISSKCVDFKNQVSIDSGVGSQTGTLRGGSDSLKDFDKSPLSSPKPDQDYVFADGTIIPASISPPFFTSPTEQQRNFSVFTVQEHVVPPATAMQADKGLAVANGPAPVGVKEQEGSQITHWQSVEAALQQAAGQAGRNPPRVLPGDYISMPPPAAPASPTAEGLGGLLEAADGSGGEDVDHCPLNGTSAEELCSADLGTADKREVLEGTKEQGLPEAGETLSQVAQASPGLSTQGGCMAEVPVSLPQEDHIPARSHEEDSGFIVEAAAIESKTALKAAGPIGYVTYPPTGNAPVFSQNDNNLGQNTPALGETVTDTLAEEINTNSPAEFLGAPGQSGYIPPPLDNSAAIPEGGSAKNGYITQPEGIPAENDCIPEGSPAKNHCITEGSPAKNGYVSLPEGSPAKNGYITQPENIPAKNGYIIQPEGSPAKNDCISEGSSAKNSYITQPEGSPAKNGYITHPEDIPARNACIAEGSPAKNGYITHPEGIPARNGCIAEGSPAQAASQEKNVWQTPQGFSLNPSNGYVAPVTTSSQDA